MPSIFDWSTTADSDTSVSGVNIAEGCPAGNLDNGLRAVMALVANTFSSALASFFNGSAALPVASGGTGSTTASTARAALGAAASGANSDITSLAALATALSIAQGGTGATTAAAALANLGGQSPVTVTSNANGICIGIPVGGTTYLIQMGSQGCSTGTNSVTFPVPFTVAPSLPVISAGGSQGGATATSYASGPSTTGFSIYNYAGVYTTFAWIAIGH